jgi:hypothetical protein
VEIIVKVDVKAAGTAEPAAHVAGVVRAVVRNAPPRIEAEEVFPGLREGHSAGMVCLVLPDDLPDAALQEIMRALQDDRLVEYAEPPSRRSAR